MHKSVRSALERSGERLSLSTVGARTGVTVILAFGDSRPYPRWVAKVASRPEASCRIATEARNLEILAPWANELRIPQVLDRCDDPEAGCLIFSGCPGFSEHFSLAPETESARDRASLEAAISWLRRFRDRVPATLLEREGMGPADEAAELERELRLSPLPQPELERLGEWLRASRTETALAAAHGDFWCGNLLFDSAGPSVIDWEGLALRSPLHDLFSLFANCAYVLNGRVCLDMSVPRFFALFFSEGPGASYVQAKLGELHTSAEELRHAFYAFVASSVRTKGGRYRETWLEIVRVLERNGFPAPWSRLRAE